MINTLPKSLIEAARKILTESQHPMIDVDGEMKHRHNSEGRPIHHTDEGIKNFHRWFGDSKAVDEHGRPLVVYHGSASNNIDVFHGGWFSDNSKVSKDFGPHIYKSYIKMKNPAYDDDLENHYHTFYGHDYYDGDHDYTLRDHAVSDKNFNSYVKTKHDGVITYDDTNISDGVSYVPFHPHQIKSSIGNNGDFHPDKPQINESTEDQQIHTTNSLGMPIHKTVEGVHNFNKWFDQRRPRTASGEHSDPTNIYK